MFVALDTAAGRAVDGRAVNDTMTRAATGDAVGDLTCLFCGESLSYVADPDHATWSFGWFTHERQPDNRCITDSVSDWHRLGQEAVARALYNWLPRGTQPIRIDAERRIGTKSEFVITDIRVTAPIKLAVEIVYLNPNLDIQRRLQTFFDEGYAAMIVLLPNGTHTPAHIERLLRRVGSIEVGRIDPQTLRVQFGSIITPDNVDFETSQWEAVPAYLC